MIENFLKSMMKPPDSVAEFDLPDDAFQTMERIISGSEEIRAELLSLEQRARILNSNLIANSERAQVFARRHVEVKYRDPEKYHMLVDAKDLKLKVVEVKELPPPGEPPVDKPPSWVVDQLRKDGHSEDDLKAMGAI